MASQNGNASSSPLRPLPKNLIKLHLSFPYNIVNNQGEVLISAYRFVKKSDLETLQEVESLYYPLPSRKVELTEGSYRSFAVSYLKDGAVYPFELLDHEGYVLLEKDSAVTMAFINGYNHLEKIYFLPQLEKIDLDKHRFIPVRYDEIAEGYAYLFPLVSQDGEVLFPKGRVVSDKRKKALDFFSDIYLAISKTPAVTEDMQKRLVFTDTLFEGHHLQYDLADEEGNLIIKKNSHFASEDVATLKLLHRAYLLIPNLNFSGKSWQDKHKEFMTQLVGNSQNQVVNILYVLGDLNSSFLNRLVAGYHETTKQLLSSVQKADEETYHHSLSLAAFALAMTISLKMELGFQYKDDKEYDLKSHDFFFGALLHDVGMIKLNPEILHKSSKDMDKTEKLEYSSHPQKGYEILLRFEKFGLEGGKGSISYSDIIKQCVLFHHERYDDKGYPTRLPYDGLPTAPKWVGLLEVFDTLLRSSKRLPEDIGRVSDAIKGLLNSSGSLLSLDMVTLFINKFAKNLMLGIPFYKEGDYVLLDSDDLCQVSSISWAVPLSPHVRLLYSGYGKKILRHTEIDLRKDMRTIKKFLSRKRAEELMARMDEQI